MSVELNDEMLIERYKAGDSDALDLLLSRYKSIVSSYSRPFFLIGGTSEDLVQEGMIALYKAVTTFDVGKNIKFAPYAKTCIKNAIRDAMRLANRDKHRALNDSVSLQDISLNDELSQSPEEMFLLRENDDKVQSKLYESLNEPQKKLLKLFLDGYSYNEIADTLGKDIKYVDNTLQKIKNKIKRTYQQNGPTEK